MGIFAIGDLHLSFSEKVEKPMDLFGPDWYNHPQRTKEIWEQNISTEDTVILVGDLSWAMKLEEAKVDLDWISSLPGYKVLVKGNHDLWST